MTQVERVLRASEISIEAEPAEGETAQWCLRQYFNLLDERHTEYTAPPARHIPRSIYVEARWTF